jgi:hypothetical protein
VRLDKTKNSLNKNNERTLIAGAIVKLLEQQQSSSMNSERNERLAIITMTIIHQMENLNKSMYDCNCWERKRWKKTHAKKRARKRMKHRALEGLGNYGGKTAGVVGSSSSSSSSSNSSSKDSSSDDSSNN